MAQEPPDYDRPDASEPDPLAREFDRIRRTALGDSKVTRRVLEAYADFRRGNDERDPAGPPDQIELVGRDRRLIVVGRVAAVTDQRAVVEARLTAAGAGIDDIEDDPRIGVSLLTVSGLGAEQLYALVMALRAEMPQGSAPISVGLDDVTYEAKITFKPINPQSGEGSARRITMSSERPRDTGRGKGITVGVIDGAFTADASPQRTDGWFDNVVPPADGRPPLNQLDPSRLDPGAGHGAFVTGIVASHAPDATIRQYRATDSWGFGSAWRLKDMILLAVEDGCQVINISLGFDDPDLLGSPALSAALHHIPSHIVVVAAAGNGGTSTPMLPASHKTAIGVGGLEADLDPVGWSNRGPWVDFSALALPVVSTYVADPADPGGDPNPWAVWAGTSFASPKVAGELAVLLASGLTPVEAIDVLRTWAGARLPNPDFGYLLELPDQFPRTQGSPQGGFGGRVFRIPPVLRVPDLSRLRRDPRIFPPR